MLKTSFLLFWRNLRNNKLFSVVNIGSLTLGIAACILMLLFINKELSFDNFHQKADRIYRLTQAQRLSSTQEQITAFSMFPMATALQQDYPMIENSVRISARGEANIKNGDQLYTTDHLIYADSSFLSIFDFELLAGNKSIVLSNPKNILLTESLALKLFETTNVIGQSIQLDVEDDYQPFLISGILKDIPENSHMQFDCVIPFHGMALKDWMTEWDASWVNTYLLLKENASIETLQAAMPAFEQKYMGERAADSDLLFQAFSSIHLDSGDIVYDYFNTKKFSRSYVHIFVVLAFFILFIGILNFVNLSTAKTTKRAKEVGIRKTIGSTRLQLIKQFTVEAIWYSLFALVVALVLASLTLPALNSIIDRSLSLEVLATPWNESFLLAFAVVIGLIAGIYPAFFLSGFQPVKTLKGVLKTETQYGFSLRSVLIVTQFAIAIVLVVSTLAVTKQLQFLAGKDVGFNTEQIIQIEMNKTANEKYTLLKERLMGNTNINGITAASDRMGSSIPQMGCRYIDEQGQQQGASMSHLWVDYNFFDFYDIQLKEGRFFSPEFSTDTKEAYIVNEALVEEIGWNEAIGMPYRAGWLDSMGQVIGVIEDFNFNSLHHKIAPLYITMLEGMDFYEMSVKINGDRREETLAFIEAQWKEIVPDKPFEWQFLDEHFGELYQTDKEVGQILSIATGLAILIACMGLFGLGVFVMESRTKEVGIRKVLGATVTDIVVLLSKNFVKLVAVSTLIAAPIGWLAMNNWLNNFAYRISLSWTIFVSAGAIALLIVLLTLFFQARSVAVTNPVESLRIQ